jgi:hypothetical protein
LRGRERGTGVGEEVTEEEEEMGRMGRGVGRGEEGVEY